MFRAVEDLWSRSGCQRVSRTFTVINALRGFFSKSRNRASSPISGRASGKLDWNHLRVFSRVFSRSNSAVGANKVQVNVLS